MFELPGLKQAEGQIAQALRPSLAQNPVSNMISDLTGQPGLSNMPSERPDFKEVFDILSGLKNVSDQLTHDPRVFRQGLEEINNYLHKLGLLPNMKIVMDGEDEMGGGGSGSPYGGGGESSGGRSSGGGSRRRGGGGSSSAGGGSERGGMSSSGGGSSAGGSDRGGSGGAGGARPGSGLSVTTDSQNPQGNAVISKSGQAPQQSPEAQQAYQQMGYDGEKATATGGGGADGQVNQAAASGVIPDENHEALIKQALQLAGEEQTPENIKAVNTIVEHESSWNPNAINLTDSNAEAGHPSQGLMQTIPTTFQENAVPGYDQNINDPLSNLAAGIKYSKQRYGGVQNVPGVENVASGEGYVGY